VDAAPLLFRIAHDQNPAGDERMRLQTKLAAIGMGYAATTSSRHERVRSRGDDRRAHHAVGIDTKAKWKWTTFHSGVSGKALHIHCNLTPPVSKMNPHSSRSGLRRRVLDGFDQIFVRSLTPEYNQLLDQLLKIFGDAVGACGRGGDW